MIQDQAEQRAKKVMFSPLHPICCLFPIVEVITDATKLIMYAFEYGSKNQTVGYIMSFPDSKSKT